VNRESSVHTGWLTPVPSEECHDLTVYLWEGVKQFSFNQNGGNIITEYSATALLRSC